jgi:hypothetical protein
MSTPIHAAKISGLPPLMQFPPKDKKVISHVALTKNETYNRSVAEKVSRHFATP